MSMDTSFTRTTNTIVHFSAPFALPDLINEMQPAGDYKFVQDEEPAKILADVRSAGKDLDEKVVREHMEMLTASAMRDLASPL